MKKLLGLILGIVILAGCQQTPSNLLSLTGTVLNPDSTELMSYIDGKRDTIDLDENGAFVFEMESEKAINMYLLYGRNNVPVYLAPGKTLDVMVDVADWNNSKSFSGDLAPENNYLLEKATSMSDWQKNARTNYLLEPTDYKAKRDSLQEVQVSFLEGYDGLSKSFVELEKLSLEFTLYSELQNFPRAHQYYAKKDDVVLPDGWDDYKESIDYNNPLLMDVPAALGMIGNWINDGAMEEAGLEGDVWGTSELLNAKIAFIENNLEDPAMKEKFIFDNLNQQLDSGPATGVEAAIENYIANSTNEENKKTLQEKVDGWESILPGKQAPGFKLPDVDGKELALSDLKGKYVYIDFWATWCGPCKAEFPHYRKLVEDYKGRNVVFMSISVDQDKAAWEKMVAEEAFDWIQLHDAEKMNDEYLVRYIPTFVFVDTEGKIIDPRAPRPSDEKLREMLDAQPGL